MDALKDVNSLSLPESLYCSHGVTNAGPHLQNSASFSSTPKDSYQSKRTSSPVVNGFDYNRRCNEYQNRIYRAPSLDSAAAPNNLSPLLRHKEKCNGDSNDVSIRTIPRTINSSILGKHSLPSTPRMPSCNGNYGLNSSDCHNSSVNFATLSDEDILSQSSVSHYLSCSSRYFGESSNCQANEGCKLPGSIDYSSLPLPHRDNLATSQCNENIYRHMSEPCITKSGLCLSPRNSLRHKSKNANRLSGGSGNTVKLFDIYESTECGDKSLDTLEIHWRFIQTLVEELNSTKASNHKLKNDLYQARLEIQVLKASLDAYRESGLQPGSITEMVGQIHAAQRVRDEAMMLRIKLANEERDAALHETQSLLEKLSLSPRTPLDNLTYLNIRNKDSPLLACKCSFSGENDHKMQTNQEFSNCLSNASSASYSKDIKLENSCGMGLCGGRGSHDDEPFQFAAALHNTVHSGILSDCFSGSSGSSYCVNVGQMESLFNQLKEKEAQKTNNNDRCTQLEKLINLLQGSVNYSDSPRNMTFVDMTFQNCDKNCLYDKNISNISTNPQHGTTESFLLSDHRDSLSSVDSFDSKSHSSFPKSEQFIGKHIGSDCPTDFMQNFKDSDGKAIPGVTILGPITEL